MLHVYKIDKDAIRRIEAYCNQCAEKRAKARNDFRHDPSPTRRAAVRMAENGYGVAKLVECGVSRADARLLVLGD